VISFVAGHLLLPELATAGRSGWPTLTWVLAGLLIAPVVLRRMARRESGSSMEVRRLQHQQRV
jgi:hypothetical protein